MAGAPFSLVIYEATLRIVWVSSVPPPYRVADFIGHHPWEFVQPEYAGPLQAAMTRCIGGDSPQVIDVCLPESDYWRNWFFLVPQFPVVRLIGVARQMPRGLEQLTEREMDICALLADGLLSKGVARRIGRSRSTVDNHRFHIAHKLGIPPNSLSAWCGANAEWLRRDGAEKQAGD